MRKFLLTATAALGGVALALAAGYVLSLPVTLKLQVPAHDTASRKLFEAAADHFKAKRLPIRDRKSTRLNSSHSQQSRMPSSA